MVAGTVPAASAGPDSLQGEEIDEMEPDLADAPDVVTTGTEGIDQIEAAAEAPPIAEAAPERVTPQLTTADPASREDAAPDVPNKAEGEN
jgi:hypothetical protein